jgi:hypothetical protein
MFYLDGTQHVSSYVRFLQNLNRLERAGYCSGKILGLFWIYYFLISAWLSSNLTWILFFFVFWFFLFLFFFFVVRQYLPRQYTEVGRNHFLQSACVFIVTILQFH